MNYIVMDMNYIVMDMNYIVKDTNVNELHCHGVMDTNGSIEDGTHNTIHWLSFDMVLVHAWVVLLMVSVLSLIPE